MGHNNIRLKMIYSIYKIVDNTNGNIYVGSTKLKMRIRIQAHKDDFKIKKYCSSSIILKNNDWDYHVIEECEEDIRFEREQYWIDNLNNVVNKNNPIKLSYDQVKDKYNEKRRKYKNYYQKENITKQEYDKRRDKWRYSFGETCRDKHTLLKIDINLFA